MTLYDILEVSPRASTETIRAAYKSLMQRHHPDKNSQTDDVAKSIAQAFGVLSDPIRRAAYDETLTRQVIGSPSENTGTGQVTSVTAE